MASMNFGVKRNGKRGIVYVQKNNNSILNPKPKENVIKPKALYSHFTCGHNHDMSYSQKSKVNATPGKTNKKGHNRI
jgi:hypothetical protein